jgi:hypothetical protein
MMFPIPLHSSQSVSCKLDDGNDVNDDKGGCHHRWTAAAAAADDDTDHNMATYLIERMLSSDVEVQRTQELGHQL